MDERRFRVALDTIEETIRDYKEETIFAALGVVAERFSWQLTKVEGAEGGATILPMRTDESA